MVREAEAAAKQKQMSIYRMLEHSARLAEEREREYAARRGEAEDYDPYAEDIIYDQCPEELVVRGDGEGV